MFTGIVEQLAKIIAIEQHASNKIFTIHTALVGELKIDQSVSHNGVCLTVVEIDLKNSTYKVVAVNETLKVSNLDTFVQQQYINIERCMILNQRLDGHIVQGHVDTMATVQEIKNENGSWLFTFEINIQNAHLIVHKGSVCVNGVSLTVIEPTHNSFKVAIIPYTYENTTFKYLKINEPVNIEFDIIGKYINRKLELENARV
jgi:riboflavin synthase